MGYTVSVRRHVVLLGLMGAGKTSIGRLVAPQLDVELIDGDERLELLTGGRTAAEVADADGLETLHEMEIEIALAALASGKPAVIGPAAAVCESATVRERLAGHVVVWLTAPAEHLAGQAMAKSHRPLVHDGDAVDVIARQLAIREPLILALDPLVIDVSTTSVDDAAALIVEHARTNG